MSNSATQIETNLTIGQPVALSIGLKRLEASDLIFYGLLTFAVHLVLLTANRALIYRSLSEHVSAEFASDYAVNFYASMFAGVFAETMFFLLGWLFICGMVVLLNGQSNSRTLFGGLLICYLPVVFTSAIAFIAYFFSLKGLSYASIGEAQSAEQLSAAMEIFARSMVFQRTAICQNIGYGALILLSIESIYRICQTSRWKSSLTVMFYVGVLMALTRLAG
ncbi:MAG: hypothetical protein KA368_22840 [Acidobacteria bacterium]|nr:hypothetical protein [Acidobacteriota bacterium]